MSSVNLGFIRIDDVGDRCDGWKPGDSLIEYDPDFMDEQFINEIILESNKEYHVVSDFPPSLRLDYTFSTGSDGMTRVKFVELIVNQYKKLTPESDFYLFLGKITINDNNITLHIENP